MTREELRFRDLGPLEIERVGEVRPVGGSRLRAWLTLLLDPTHATPSGRTRCARPYGADQGVEPSSATTPRLARLARLRRLLEPDRASGAPPTNRPGPRARRLPAGRRPVRIDSAASRHWPPRPTGPAHAGGGRGWGAGARAGGGRSRCGAGAPTAPPPTSSGPPAAVARLEEIRGRLRETHIGALLGTGALDRALAELEIALAEEPLRERLWAYADDRLPRQRPPIRRTGHLHRARSDPSRSSGSNPTRSCAP